MPLIGAQYLPHGNLILAPKDFYPQLMPGTQDCHDAMRALARDAKALSPDLIVMTFPHGITCDDEFTIYQHNEFAGGDGEWLKEWKEFTVRVKIDQKATAQVKKYCNSSGLKMCGMTTNGAGPTVDALLRWSEVVPIWFLEHEFQNAVPYVLINNPLSSTWENPAGKLRELQQFGDLLHQMCTTGPLASRRVLLIVSGDQSHVLDHPHHDLPLGLGYKSHPYGVHPHGPLFDSAIRKWCASLSPRDFQESIPYMKEAKTCGAAGLITLERIVELLKAEGKKVEGKVTCEIAPVYYGMLCAKFDWVGF